MSFFTRTMAQYNVIMVIPTVIATLQYYNISHRRNTRDTPRRVGPPAFFLLLYFFFFEYVHSESVIETGLRTPLYCYQGRREEYTSLICFKVRRWNLPDSHCPKDSRARSKRSPGRYFYK